MDEKHRVGMIRKHWSGFGREMFTVSDMFGIHFPRNLDVKIKAVLLGACILIVGIVKIYNRFSFSKRDIKKKSIKRNIATRKKYCRFVFYINIKIK